MEEKFDWSGDLTDQFGRKVISFNHDTSIGVTTVVFEDGRGTYVFTSSGRSERSAISSKTRLTSTPKKPNPDEVLAKRLRELDEEYNQIFTDLTSRGYRIHDKYGELKVTRITKIVKSVVTEAEL